MFWGFLVVINMNNNCIKQLLAVSVCCTEDCWKYFGVGCV